jgi:hypothetical protein
MNAADDLDDGRFAAAVFAGEAVYFTGLDFQRYTLQRMNSAEGLADIDRSEQVLGHCKNPPCGGLNRRSLDGRNFPPYPGRFHRNEISLR